MNIVKLHQLIDEWAAEERAQEEVAATPIGDLAAGSTATISQESAADQPNTGPNEKGQRVVRTKTSGDRVYLLDENNKTRQWVTTPQILEALGFTLNNVSEVEETEFLKYSMGPALHKLPDGPQA